ncbi:MAG: SusC/RagA family TonB-linked outer membrane protein [Paenibacillus sp.]|nr:SusC/RagA family TonB-linked outer membrane protein [Paenibacillus sp.]
MNTVPKYIGYAAFALALATGVTANAQSDSLVNVAFGTKPAEDVITATQQVNMAELMKKNYSTSALDLSLESLIGGYRGGSSIWGQNALVLVDGMPREIGDILASEVESISFLKDAAAAALYGSRGAKGVILVTTKRGTNSPMQIDFRADVGFVVPKSYPNYLDAASYMTLYNEACRNDGLSERYSANEIYNSSISSNPYQYPNQKYYNGNYLRKFSNNYMANGEIYGGNERTHYYLNMGLGYSDGLVKIGDHDKDNTLRFNVRGNVDMTITKWLTGFTNASFLVNDNYEGRGDFWGMASGTWPNRYGVLLPVDMIDPNNAELQAMVAAATLIDGRYLLGGTSNNSTNAIADAYEAGYVKTKTRSFMFDLGLKFDLGAILRGLTFKTVFGVDYRAVYSEGFKEDYAVYEPTWANVNGKPMIVDLKKHGNDTNSTNEYVGQSTYLQNMMFRGQFDYNRVFGGLHQVDATLMGWGYQTQYSNDANHNSSPLHATTNVNAGAQVAYNYDHRYYATLTGVLVHSSKLAEGHRNAFSPSVSLGWRIGQENFIKENAPWINELKLTASASKLHQDLDIEDYYLYKGYYGFKDGGGWWQWHDGTAGGNTTMPKRADNLGLTFITREEFRVGLDAALFDNLLTLNANYFIQDTKGGLTQGSNSIFPNFMSKWDASFLPWLNYNNDRRQGVDFSLNLRKTVGEVDLGLGFAGMYYTDKATRRDEMPAETYLAATGQPLNRALGYICEGFYQSQEEIDNRGVRQTFGGTLRPGDLRYKDVNGDGVVDSNDRVVLGRYTPTFSYGLNLSASWRGFTLYAYGTGQAGGTAFNNNSYYCNGGDAKYSEMAWGRWTPETAATATAPRLTTGTTANNNQTSTFWQYSTNRFDIRRVQLTYDLPASLFNGNKVLSGVSVYLQGENLATISPNRKIMELSTSSPQARNYNVGCKLSF